MIGKLISKLIGFIFWACVLAFIAIPGYFWYRSGQPMQVKAAQQITPGITMREFWASRVEQWKQWDNELRRVGKKGACLESGYVFFTLRAIAAGPFVLDLRLHQDDQKYTQSVVEGNNNVIPSDELLYDSNLIDAWWAMIEESSWSEYAHAPGFPVKALGQRRVCSTTYPVAMLKIP